MIYNASRLRRTRPRDLSLSGMDGQKEDGAGTRIESPAPTALRLWWDDWETAHVVGPRETHGVLRWGCLSWAVLTSGQAPSAGRAHAPSCSLSSPAFAPLASLTSAPATFL